MSNGSGSSVDPAAAQDSMKALEKLAAMLARVTDETGRYTDATNELERALEDGSRNNERRANEQEQELERREKQWKALRKQASEITSLSDAYNVAASAVKLYIKQNETLAKAALRVTAAFKGAVAGAKLTAAALKGIFSIGGSLVSMFFDIGAAIISIPFKFFNHIFGKAKELMSGGTELAQAYEDVRKVFGDTGSGLGKSVIDLGKNLTKGLITPGLSARRVFGDMAEAIKYANEVASAAPEAFQAVSDQFSGKNGLEILAMAKGLGIANEELVGFMDSAIATGQSMESMLTDVTKYAKGMGDAFGLNSKMISRSMAKAAKDVKHFANSSVKEIARATVYAQKLGVSLESITGILDAFNTFESAAENVSKLSQAFGVNLDAMKLLEAKTPDEALDQVKQAFLAAGKSADQMNRQELQLIASTVGMDEATVRKTLSMKNAGVSMQNVKGVASSLEAQTMNTSQALEKLSKDIEKMVKAGEPPKGDNFLDVFIEGFIEGVDRSGKMRELFKDTAKAIQMVRVEGRLLGDFFVKNFPGFSDFIEGLSEKMEQVPKLFANIRKSLESFISGLNNGSSSFEGLMNSIQKNVMDFMGGDNSKMSKGLAKMWNATKKILAEGINWLTDRLKEGLDAVVGFLKNPMEAQMNTAGGILGGVQKEISPITESLKRMWIQLKDPLKELLWEAAKEFIAALWEGLQALPWQAWVVLLGPMLSGGIGNLILTSVAKGIAGALTSETVKTAVTSWAGSLKNVFQGAMSAFSTAGGGGAGAWAGMVALGPVFWGIAAALAVIAAWDQGSKLYDELQDMEDTRKKQVEASAQATQNVIAEGKNYHANNAILQEQLEIMEKKKKLGDEIGAAEAKAMARKAQAAREESETAATTQAYAAIRQASHEAIEELTDYDTNVAEAMAGIEGMSAGLKAAVDSKIKGSGKDALREYESIMDQIRKGGLSGATEGTGEITDASLKGVVAALEGNKSAAGMLAGLDLDTLETSNADIFQQLGMKDIDLNQAQAGYVKMYANYLVQKRQYEENEAKRLADEAAGKKGTNTTSEDMAAAKKRLEEQKERENKAQIEVARKETLEGLGLDTKWTPQTAEVAINKVEELAKKLGKTDVEATMKEIRAKMDKIDFRIFTNDAKKDEVTNAAINMGLILDIFNRLGAIGPEVTKTKNSLMTLSQGKGIDGINVAIDKFTSMFKGDQNLFSRIKKLIDVVKEDSSQIAAFTTTINEYFTGAGAAVEALRTGAEGVGADAMTAKGQLEIEGGAIASLHQFGDVIMTFFNDFSRIEKAVATAQQTSTNIAQATSEMDGFIKSFSGITNFFTAENAATVKASITHMVDSVNTINKGLSNIKIGEKDVRVKLSDAAGGIVKKAFEPIKAGGATISLTLNVQMSATDLAAGLVRSPSGIIRSAFREALAGTGKDMNDNGVVGPIA